MTEKSWPNVSLSVLYQNPFERFWWPNAIILVTGLFIYGILGLLMLSEGIIRATFRNQVFLSDPGNCKHYPSALRRLNPS